MTKDKGIERKRCKYLQCRKIKPVKQGVESVILGWFCSKKCCDIVERLNWRQFMLMAV